MGRKTMLQWTNKGNCTKNDQSMAKKREPEKKN